MISKRHLCALKQEKSERHSGYVENNIIKLGIAALKIVLAEFQIIDADEKYEKQFAVIFECRIKNPQKTIRNKSNDIADNIL